MAIIAILSIFLYVGLVEIQALFGRGPGLISQIIQARKEHKSYSLLLGGEKETERMLKRTYLSLLEERVSPEEYARAERMKTEELEIAFAAELEEGKREHEIILLGEAFDLLREFFIGYVYLIFFFRFGGQTPGKRLIGLRVIDLKGKDRLGWYQAFERTHGYAASALALSIGYLQVLWNPEGLTMHDKLAETTVVRLPKKERGGFRIKVKHKRREKRSGLKQQYDYSDLLR
jgi:hypothetical protein